MTVEEELDAALQKIMASESRKKLIVAGPGTGKTTLFSKLLARAAGDQGTRLVLTFIRALTEDLGRSLGELARVSTLHGYCQSLLHRDQRLRGRLTENFRCVPEMASLIKRDWEIVRGAEAPRFVDAMRNLQRLTDLGYYFDRADYYDAVDFDDSVYRTLDGLGVHPGAVEALDLILIDEFQDFNAMEARFVETLASKSSIVVAGDDDQALYSQLRSATWDHIRAMYQGGNYEVFALPFCMRCPEVVVSAVSDIVAKAKAALRLQGRIEKPYRHFEPKKGPDSKMYPKITLVGSSVQSKAANYLGRFIVRAVKAIPGAEVEEAAQAKEPAALVIGPGHYLDQVEDALVAAGLPVERTSTSPRGVGREVGLEILAGSPDSNIGWRVALEHEAPRLTADCVRATHERPVRLIDVVPEEHRARILAEAKAWKVDEERRKAAQNAADTKAGSAPLRIKLTSFEGAKGLSAQHVYIVGLQDGVLPRNPAAVQDIEVCRLLVGITRTKKRCCLMFTNRFAGTSTKPSTFLKWIKKDRLDPVRVDAAYWERESE